MRGHNRTKAPKDDSGNGAMEDLSLNQNTLESRERVRWPIGVG